MDFKDMVMEYFVKLFIPFLAYFVGILIRHKVFSSKGSPPLSHQIFLGIPFSLTTVTVFLGGVNPNFDNNISYLATIGFIMQQGLVMNEAATKRIKQLMESS